jgi:hypothetical protein
VELELDHFFILTDPGAQAGDALAALGVEESFSRDHKGQGTSNRRFPVSNSMLELLWVRDADEARNGPAKNMLFAERAEDKSASPFGLIFTRKDKASNTLPFAGWSYQPDYFDPSMAFHVGENSEQVMEPLCIYVPFMDPVARTREEGKFRSISHVRITLAAASLSDTLAKVSSIDGLEIALGDEHLMEVTFNKGSYALSTDLRPRLPLVIQW